MEYIKIIKDSDFDEERKELNNPRIRIGARGIIFNNENKIAILNKQNKNEYKLIGGGVENDETPEMGFIRESMEEAGCKIQIDKFIGIIREERTHYNFVQKSYVYVAHVLEDTKELHLTKKEKDEGSKLLWLDIDEAMEIIKECENNLVGSEYEDVYTTKFIVRRDYNILNYYKEDYANN